MRTIIKLAAVDGREWGLGGCTHGPECRSHQTIYLASLQSRDGARRVFAGPGSHQSPSAKRHGVFGDSHEG